MKPTGITLIIITLMLGMLSGAWADTPGEPQGAGVSAAPASKLPPRELERYKAALWLVIMVLSVFVVGITLMTLQRMIRRQKQKAGLGQKTPPTEYVDSWKLYRLKDEDLKRISEDESDG